MLPWLSNHYGPCDSMKHIPVHSAHRPARINRVLSFPLVVLYGLGVTIGAGIYVLVGEATSRAGALAPFAFVLAALVMIFPALSFSELAVRYPFASGSAQFAEEGLKSRLVGFCVGMAVISAGLVTAATISLGAAGVSSDHRTVAALGSPYHRRFGNGGNCGMGNQRVGVVCQRNDDSGDLRSPGDHCRRVKL